MAKRPKRQDSTTPDEQISDADGIASEALMKAGPSIDRYRMLHQLRVAARHCPFSAYNLSWALSESADTVRNRRLRRRLALEMAGRAADMASEMLRNPDEPFEKSPPDELNLRSVIAMALTNIGAAVANAGHPDRAIHHFKRAIATYPLMGNSHVCMGNMGVYFSEETGLDPLSGIRSWEKARDLNEGCYESAAGCTCRSIAIDITRSIEKQYGADQARGWLAKRSATIKRKHGSLFGPYVVLTPSHLPSERRKIWSRPATQTIDRIAPIFPPTEWPLEKKISFASSLVATVLLHQHLPKAGPALMDAALAVVDGVEPLAPFLGDHEWLDVSPPETDYLDDKATADEIMVDVRVMLSCLFDDPAPVATSDALVAILFHLDFGFRQGVAQMALQALPRWKRGQHLYLPAYYVGNRPVN